MAVVGPLEQPTASFVRSGKEVRLCLNYLEIRDQSGGVNPGELVWEIRSEGDECVVLDRVVYGEAPHGFTVIHAAEPLQAAVSYYAFGQGSTAGVFGGSAVGGGAFRYHDGSWWQPTGDRR